MLTIAFTLIAVIVGSYISYHGAEGFSVEHQSHIQAEHSVAEACGDLDPCEQGHCHLGHCTVFAKLAIVQIVHAEFSSVLNESVGILFLNRAIDAPTEPPRNEAIS